MSWRVRTVFVVLVLGSGMSAAAWGQASDPRSDPISDPEWLRAFLERERQAHRLPAIAAAIVLEGKVVAASAVGVRKAGSPARVTRNDPFHLGSLAKPMSATMFGVLVDQGLLRWDMTMAEMFPELVDAMQPEYRPVTIAQLLSHTSGFPYQPETSEQIIDARATMIAGRRYEYVKAAIEDPPAAPPGTKVIDSGGAIVVASAAERLTRQSYEGLIHRLLFKPLGMTHAGFGDMSAHGRIDGPWSHVIRAGAVTPIPPDRSEAVQTRAPFGRNVHCSIIDLARFAALHIHGAQGRSRFLRPETFRRLQTAVPPSNFAPGWAIEHPEWSKGTVLAHNGSNGRNYAVCRVAPAEGFAVCVMTNLGGDEANAACESALAWLVARIRRGRLTEDGSLAYRPVPPRPDIPLENLAPEKATTGFGQVRTNRTAADTPLWLDGVTYVHGIGVHANSELSYAIKPAYRRFVAQVGIDDKQTWHGTVVVKVYAGTKLLLESGVIRGGDSPWNIDVPLPDRVDGRPPQELRLVVDGTPDGIHWDLTDWIHAGFLTSS
jgi:CubicO group peptidase (beta-lactamase class C family)